MLYQKIQRGLRNLALKYLEVQRKLTNVRWSSMSLAMKEFINKETWPPSRSSLGIAEMITRVLVKRHQVLFNEAPCITYSGERAWGMLRQLPFQFPLNVNFKILTKRTSDVDWTFDVDVDVDWFEWC